MKPLLTRLKQQLVKDRGMSTAKAHEVAVKTLQDSGSLYRGTETPTRKGIARAEMGAAGRAIDRAATRSGRDPGEYIYSSKTNRATLRKK